MPTGTAAEVRPRTTGEVLDDACDLALADAGPLLLCTGLFAVPAFAVLLLLLARPAPAGVAQLVLPTLAALLLPLTGLGSGACQELFRLRAEGRPVHLAGCLGAALRRGLEHVAARAAVLVGGLLGLGCLLLPGLAVWCGFATVHALLAERRGDTWAGLPAATHESSFDAGKAGLVVLSRLPLLLMVATNLHLLALAGLWAAEQLGGLDVSLLREQLGPTNPVYVAALLLLCWLLLAPYFEAANFLLHVDGRARREGLDLMVRVQRAFAAEERAPRPAWPERVRLGLLVLVGLALATPAARGEGARVRPLSREEVRSFLRGQAPQPGETRRFEKEARKKAEPRRSEVRRDEKVGPRTGRPASAPGPGGGLGSVGWLVLAGLALAVLFVAGLLYRSTRRPNRSAPSRRESGSAAPVAEAPLPHERPAAAWWRQAEEHAAAGRHAEAARALYLAVLSLLHRQGLLRYEPTRTNGEYVRQVRLAAEADPELPGPFERLTGRFEAHCYGGMPCGAGEYGACRALAEAIRKIVKG
jgi:hypothetical protein